MSLVWIAKAEGLAHDGDRVGIDHRLATQTRAEYC